MKREYFLMHLETFGCTLIRHDSRGYSVYRHAGNKTKSGIPKDDPLLRPTVCRICLTLGIDAPLDMAEADELIKRIHKDTNEFE